MGKHFKRQSSSHTGRNVAAISISGAFAAIPLTQGTALASPVSESHPVQAVVQPSIDWTNVIRCESGGNPKARNPRSTASGLFQFLRSTWVNNGGGSFSRTAAEASPAQQLEIANRVYARSGLTPWAASRSCWRGQVNERGTTSVTDVSMTTPLPAKHGHGHKKRHGKHAKSTPDTTPAVTPTAPVPATYTVKAGDSLARIAAEHHATWQSLWQANRQAVANPALIHIGQRITLSSSSVPTPSTSSVAAAPSAAAGGVGTHLEVDLTGYSFQDNSGSNNATISQPVIHQQASGTGTFSDPITVASPGSAGSTESPKGTRFYSPKLARYLIVEDSGATKESTTHLDVWVSGQGSSKSATDACESSFTGKSDVIKNPPAGLPVTPGPIFANGKCNVPGGSSSGGDTASDGKHHHKG